MLDTLGRNLTALARDGKLHEVIGRDAELKRMLTILMRTQKSNPLLLGEAGVGKTAIVEGLAWRIAHGKVPSRMRGKRIFELDIGGLTAGTKYRGEFDAYFKTVVTEARRQPDKSIDVIDEACARVLCDDKQMVNSAEIEQLISEQTGIPVGRLTTDESLRYSQMESKLNSRVVGQREAVKAVVDNINQARIGLKEPQRPMGVFLFLGPSGVGKTKLAKELAKYLFDAPEALVRFDMSEYGEPHSRSKLIGFPPGYVDYAEGGRLTEALRRQPTPLSC